MGHRVMGHDGLVICHDVSVPLPAKRKLKENLLYGRRLPVFQGQPSFVVGFRLGIISIIASAFRVETCNFFMDRDLIFMIVRIINCFTNFNRFTCLCLSNYCTLKGFTCGLFPINARSFMFFKERNLTRTARVFRRAILMSGNDQCSIISNGITRRATFCLCLRNMFLRFCFRTTNGLHFIRSAFTSRCKAKLIVRMIRRNFKGITSINRPATYNFLLPLFKMTIALGTSELKNSSNLFRGTRSNFVLTSSFFRRFISKCFRLIRLVNRDHVSNGRNNNTINE